MAQPTQHPPLNKAVLSQVQKVLAEFKEDEAKCNKVLEELRALSEEVNNVESCHFQLKEYMSQHELQVDKMGADIQSLRKKMYESNSYREFIRFRSPMKGRKASADSFSPPKTLEGEIRKIMFEGKDME